MPRLLTPEEKKEVYEHIRTFLSDELDVPLEDIGPDTKIIDDLHGDSMIYLELIEDFKRVEGDLHDSRALELAWITQLCWHAPLLAHELVEASDEKRERARAELAWWVERVRATLELL